MTALTAVGATSASAQDVCTEVEAKQAVYKQITDNYAAKELDKQQVAVDAGKQYISKYGACADDKQIIDWINKNILPMEAKIAVNRKQEQTAALYKNFDAALDAVKTNGSKTADVFSTGKAILAQEPDMLDVILVLASAGYDQSIANPPVDTLNDETIRYSRMAIEKLEANTTSKTGSYGVKQFNYKSDKYTDSRNNALGMMNYNIGYIMYYRQGKDNPAKKKEALPFLYKATQYNSFSKDNPETYRTIGAWYLEEAIRLDAERTKALQAAGNKDTEETLNLLGLQKGYADRAIDAYARAYKLASANKDPKNKAYTDGLYGKLTELYKFRYDNTAGIDAFVATVSSKPMPDPSTPVTPVKEEAPTTTTSTTSNTTSTTASPAAMTSDTTTATTTARPAATNTTATSKTTDASNGAAKSTATKTTNKTAVKKPAPKKKGTR